MKNIDLGDIQQKNGTVAGHENSAEILSDFPFEDWFQGMPERKKMFFFKPCAYIDYLPCRLSEGKEWFISYYVKNPETGKLKRMRIKINRIKKKGERRRVARMMMTEINLRLAMGWNPLLEKDAPMAGTRLFDAIDAFMAVKMKELEESSLRSYRSYIKILKTWLVKNGIDGEAYCSVITKRVAMAFMDSIETEQSAKSYNNYITFCRGLFNWMKTKGYVDANPFDAISKKPRRLTKKKRRVLTDDELSRLWRFLKGENEEYLAMCLICYCCFIRPKELALLRCGDIDLERQVIHIREEVAKNDSESYRTIQNELLPVLSKLDLTHPEYFLFGQNKEGDFRPGPKQMCSRKIAKWWDNHVRPACSFGMDVQFYSLKDTGITNMLGQGVAINLVQQQADHSSIAMTALYVGRKAEAESQLKSASILSMRNPMTPEDK